MKKRPWFPDTQEACRKKEVTSPLKEEFFPSLPWKLLHLSAVLPQRCRNFAPQGKIAWGFPGFPFNIYGSDCFLFVRVHLESALWAAMICRVFGDLPPWRFRDWMPGFLPCCKMDLKDETSKNMVYSGIFIKIKELKGTSKPGNRKTCRQYSNWSFKTLRWSEPTSNLFGKLPIATTKCQVVLGHHPSLILH